MNDTAYLVVSIKDLKALLAKAQAAQKIGNRSGDKACVIIEDVEIRTDSKSRLQLQIPVGYTHGDRQF